MPAVSTSVKPADVSAASPVAAKAPALAAGSRKASVSLPLKNSEELAMLQAPNPSHFMLLKQSGSSAVVHTTWIKPKFQNRLIALFRGSLQYFEKPYISPTGEQSVFPYGTNLRGWLDLSDYEVLVDITSEDGKVELGAFDIMLHFCNSDPSKPKRGRTMSYQDILLGKGTKDLLLRVEFIEEKMRIVGLIKEHITWAQKFHVNHAEIRKQWEQLVRAQDPKYVFWDPQASKEGTFHHASRFVK